MRRRLFAAFSSAILFGLTPAFIALLPRAGEPVAIVTLMAAREDIVSTIARADGQLLALPYSRVAIARSDQPAFAARLRAAGAWLVFDAAGLAGCLPVESLKNISRISMLQRGARAPGATSQQRSG